MAEIKKILFPVDFTDSSRKIIPHLLHFAQKFGAEIHIVHVVRGPEEFSGFEMGAAWWSTYEKELIDGAQKAMDRFVEEALPGHSVITKVLMGDIVGEILNYAKGAGVQLIIMGTHGRKGLEKVMFGSVAEGVVKAADCPVLTINPYKV
ncbi:MAG: universal stress protein [Deltaproteobacteria bacterium]